MPMPLKVRLSFVSNTEPAVSIANGGPHRCLDLWLPRQLLA